MRLARIRCFVTLSMILDVSLGCWLNHGDVGIETSDRVTGLMRCGEGGGVIISAKYGARPSIALSLGPGWCQINLIIRSSQWDKAQHRLGKKSKVFGIWPYSLTNLRDSLLSKYQEISNSLIIRQWSKWWLSWEWASVQHTVHSTGAHRSGLDWSPLRPQRLSRLGVTLATVMSPGYGHSVTPPGNRT